MPSSSYPGLRGGGSAEAGSRAGDFHPARSGAPSAPSEFGDYLREVTRPSAYQELQDALRRAPSREVMLFQDFLRNQLRPPASAALRAAAGAALRRSLPFAAWEAYKLINHAPGAQPGGEGISTDVPEGWTQVFGPCAPGADHYHNATQGDCGPPVMAHAVGGAEYLPGDELGFSGGVLPAGQVPGNYGVARWMLHPVFNELGTLQQHQQYDLIRAPFGGTTVDVDFGPKRRLMPNTEPLPRMRRSDDDDPKRVLLSWPSVEFKRDTLTISEREGSSRYRHRHGDKKVRVHVRGVGYVKRLISTATEGLDFSTCLINSLPREWKRRMPKTLQGRMDRVAQFLRHASGPQLDRFIVDTVKCAVTNHVEDMFFAWIGRKLALASERAFPTSGGVRGFQTGQWAWQDVMSQAVRSTR